jgi:hypothetical protein
LQAINAQLTGCDDNQRCRSLVYRAGWEFLPVIPLVEPEPCLMRVGIMDMGGLYTGISRRQMEKLRIPENVPGLGMPFEIVKRFNGEEYPVHRQDQRVERDLI